MADLKDILLNKNLVIPEDFDVFTKIFKHFRGRQVVSGEERIPGDRRPLLEKTEEFYLKPTETGGFLQGDVLEGVTPVWLAVERDELKAFSSEKRTVMILSK